jgi:hypothetical protein
MLNRFIVFLLLLVITTHYASAQYKFSSDPATFVTDVNTMMATSKNPAAIEAGNTFGATITSLPTDQQKKLIATVQSLGKSKKVRSHPGFTYFFNSITAAKAANITPSNFDTLLIITTKLTEQYDSKVVQGFFSFLNDFFVKGLLYGSNYNRLRMTGGSYSFSLAENKSPVEEMMEVVEEKPVEEKPVEDENFFSDWDTAEENPDNVGENPPAVEENVLDVGYSYPPQPTIDGPVLQLKNVDLTFATASDSVTLKNTSGAVRLKDYIFIGKGGTMDWTTAGLSPNTF